MTGSEFGKHRPLLGPEPGYSELVRHAEISGPTPDPLHKTESAFYQDSQVRINTVLNIFLPVNRDFNKYQVGSL